MRCFCSSVPWAMIVGPAIPSPMTPMCARRLGARHLLEEDRLVGVRRAGAAVLLRPGQARVAGLVELPAPLAARLLEAAAAGSRRCRFASIHARSSARKAASSGVSRRSTPLTLVRPVAQGTTIWRTTSPSASASSARVELVECRPCPPRSRSTGSRPACQSAIKSGMSRCGTAEPRYEPFSVRLSATSESAFSRQLARGVGEADRDRRAAARRRARRRPPSTAGWPAASKA